MNRRGNVALAIVAWVPFLIFVCARIVMDVNFDRNIEGHLKLAADSSSIELAIDELKIATAAMEAYPAGFTSIIYNTPDESVTFWIKNTKTCLNQLEVIPKTASLMDKNSSLLKARQILLDHKSNGESVTSPAGISIYPFNLLWTIFGTLTICFGVAGFIVAAR